MNYLAMSVLVPLILMGCMRDFKKDINPIYIQYSFALSNSYEFMETDGKHQKFMSDINEFIEKDTTYNHPAQRMAPIICQPILLSSNRQKSLSLILQRDIDLSGKRLEVIRFIYGELTKDKWQFSPNSNATKTFSYASDAVSDLSDQEIALRVFRTMLESGYMKNKTCEINDSFFEGFWCLGH